MTDPFDALYTPVMPVAPAPDFAARLHNRLIRALSPTPNQEKPMSDVQHHPHRARNGSVPGDISYISLGLPDGARGRAFYASVLGWRFAPSEGEQVGVQVEEVVPEIGVWAGPQRGGSHSHGAVLAFRVDDIAAGVARVRAAGGDATEPITRPYGMEADCTDDQGLGFYLHELPPPELPAAAAVGQANGASEGDVTYVSLLVDDIDRARTFFSSVLDWGSLPGPSGGIQVTGPTPMIGIGRSRGRRRGAILSYRVNDVAAAVARVRDAGGTAEEPHSRPYALEAECTDDQDTPFYLHEFPG